MSSSNNQLPIAIAKWLQTNAKTNDALKGTLESFAAALNIDTEALEAKTAFDLETAYEKGASEIRGEVESSDLFQKFLTTVKSRGAFKNAVEGTPEYQQVYDKVLQKFLSVNLGKKSEVKPSEDDMEKKAGDFKTEGNAHFSKGEHDAAIKCYTSALEASGTGPNSHVFYSNRAACYIAKQDYKAAESDCSAAIALKPDFAKAHARMAMVMHSVGRDGDAKESAERALSLDPSNASAADILKRASDKLNLSAGSDAGAAGAMPDLASMMQGLGGAGGMPDLASMMGGGGAGGMPDLASMMGGGGEGGMPDLSSMMNNPMVQSMMQNPQMMQMASQMMQNPDMMSNLMGSLGGGAGGGQPDLSALAGMMGGLGGNKKDES